jgi:hypothetical protein
MEDPPAAPTRTPGKVLWKPEQGFRFAQDSVQKALEDWRNSLMASMPESQRYTLDWPYFSVDDVSLSGDGGNALICSGYGPNKDTWVANFKVDADSTIAIDPFAQWTPAKQEWVAASEQVPTSPAGRGGRPPVRRRGPDASSPLNHLGLREAQAIRTERSRLGTPSSTTGGTMGRLDDLLSRGDLQLSEEDREILLSESQRLNRLEETEAQRRARERLAEVTAYCGEVKHDGTVVGGKLDDIGLGDPGVKKYVRNACSPMTEARRSSSPSISRTEARRRDSPRRPPSCSRASSTSCPRPTRGASRSRSRRVACPTTPSRRKASPRAASST